MAAVFGVITGAFGLATFPFFATGTILGMQSYFNGPANPPKDHAVRIHFGSPRGADTGISLGGNQPGVALFYDDGSLIGRTPGQSTKWASGSFVDVLVKPNKGQENRRADYVAISDGGPDGVCISAVETTFPGGEKQTLFMGMIIGCGGSHWYYSNNVLGPDRNVRPPCMWIDRDHSRGIKNQGFSYHLPDIQVSDARLKQYTNNINTWCKSPPRMSTYMNMRVENDIPIFWPRLSYKEDGSDVDINAVLNPKTAMSGSVGRKMAVMNIENVSTDEAETVLKSFKFNTEDAKYVKAVPENDVSESGERLATENGEDFRVVNKTEDVVDFFGENDAITTVEEKEGKGQKRRRRNAKYRAQHHAKHQAGNMGDALIRTSFQGHSAQALCQNELSLGPSLTNPAEGLHCDMTTRELYPLCAEGVTERCFDDKTHEIREPGVAVARGVGTFKIHKKYTDVQTWDE